MALHFKTVLALAAGVGFAAVASASVPLPKEYNFCDYVETTSRQWLDTGVEAQANLRIDADVSMTKGGSVTCLIAAGKAKSGEGGASETAGRIGFGMSTATKVRVMHDANYSGEAIMKNGERASYCVYFPIAGRVSYSYDGTEYTGDKEYPTLSDDCFGRNLYLFADNRESAGGAADFAYNTKLYSMQIYVNATGLKDGELVRDFIPCQRIEDEVFGVWDKVRGMFYPSRGDPLRGKVSDPQPPHEQPGLIMILR